MRDLITTAIPNPVIRAVRRKTNLQMNPQDGDQLKKPPGRLWKKHRFCCDQCRQPGEVHFRVTTDRLTDWIFVCETCWSNLREALVIAMEEPARPTAAKTRAVTACRFTSARIHGESPCRGVPKSPALTHPQRATTNGHRCNWVNQRCWCVEAATPSRASAPEHHPQAGFLPKYWEYPPSDR